MSGKVIKSFEKEVNLSLAKVGVCAKILLTEISIHFLS